MASSPISLWQIDGETVETVTEFIFLGSIVTADGNGSHEIQRRLLLGRKVMTNLDSILKSRDITLPTNRSLSSQSYSFSSSHVWMWVGAESKLSAEELMLLNCCVGEDSWVPWTARRSSQSILNEISPEYSLKDWCWSWNCNIWAIWCEELTHWKRPWCWERLKVGWEGDNRGWDGWMASPTQ